MRRREGKKAAKRTWTRRDRALAFVFKLLYFLLIRAFILLSSISFSSSLVRHSILCCSLLWPSHCHYWCCRFKLDHLHANNMMLLRAHTVNECYLSWNEQVYEAGAYNLKMIDVEMLRKSFKSKILIGFQWVMR